MLFSNFNSSPNPGRVLYTLSDNRITQNYLAFSCIVGNSKQDFTFTKKSKFEFTWTQNRFYTKNHGKIKFSITRHRKSIRDPLQGLSVLGKQSTNWRISKNPEPSLGLKRLNVLALEYSVHNTHLGWCCLGLCWVPSSDSPCSGVGATSNMRTSTSWNASGCSCWSSRWTRLLWRGFLRTNGLLDCNVTLLSQGKLDCHKIQHIHDLYMILET